MSEVKEVKRVSKKALNKSLWNWFLSSMVATNYENFQGTGFAYSMVPITKELYADDAEGRKEVMNRSLSFYNCTPEVMVIHGVTIAMEEQIANGAEVNGEDVVGIKAALMGPLAGIGDALIQGVIIPILLALFIDMAHNGFVAAPVLYFLVMYAIIIGVMFFTFKFGYEKGCDSITTMISNGTIDKILRAAGIMGCAVMGGLIVKFVSLNCALEFSIGSSVFNIQTSLFDAIIPSILPLGLTYACMEALKKGKKTIHIILALIVIGIIGGFLGILG